MASQPGNETCLRWDHPVLSVIRRGTKFTRSMPTASGVLRSSIEGAQGVFVVILKVSLAVLVRRVFYQPRRVLGGAMVVLRGLLAEFVRRVIRSRGVPHSQPLLQRLRQSAAKFLRVAAGLPAP